MLEALPGAFERAGLAVPSSRYAEGCAVDGDDESGFADAVAARAQRPTSRSWSSATRPACSAAARSARATTPSRSSCPGVQRRLVEAVVATGTPVVLVLLTGRPYAVDWALDGETRSRRRAAGVLPGRGRRPRDRRHPHRRGQPVRSAAGLAAAVGRRAAVLVPASDPRRPVGRDGGRLDARCCRSASGCRTRRSRTPTCVVDAAVAAGGGVQRRGDRDQHRAMSRGADVVQLYGHDVAGSVTRPVAQLLGYARVELEPGDVALAPSSRCRRRASRSATAGWSESWSRATSRCGSPRTRRPPGCPTARRHDRRGDRQREAARARRLAGTCTARAIVAITGEVYPVSTADARVVGVRRTLLVPLPV